MEISLEFIGRAEPLAALYEGVGQTSFAIRDTQAEGLWTVAPPQIGDVLSLRMHPGPDIRRFRCIGRHWDFSEVGAPLLRVELDMAD